MLAQNFKTAADLGITEQQKDALIKTLVLMETNKMSHVPHTELRCPPNIDLEFNGFFNMAYSYAIADCGTVGCIRGTAEMISGVEFPVLDLPDGLGDLFYSWGGGDPGPAEAAIALRSYLTTGDPRWDLAVSS